MRTLIEVLDASPRLKNPSVLSVGRTFVDAVFHSGDALNALGDEGKIDTGVLLARGEHDSGAVFAPERLERATSIAFVVDFTNCIRVALVVTPARRSYLVHRDSFVRSRRVRSYL